MKILIYGKGYVGSRIKDQYPDAVFGVSDIRNQDTVRKEILDIHPDIVINTAAKIGTRKPVECEDYPEETMEVNAIAPEKIAQICQEENIFFVHISTGYLYSGDNDGKGFFEEDTPNFVHGIYSQSKYEAEQNLQKYMENTAILRINKPVDCKSYSDNPSRNQLEKIGSYNKVFDMKTNITYIPFFLEVLAIIIQKRDTWIFNVVSKDMVSNIDIMKAYVQYMDPEHQYEVVEMTEYQKKNSPACFLNTEKVSSLWIEVPSGQEILGGAYGKLRSQS